MTAPLYAGPFFGPNDTKDRGPDKSPYLRGIKRGLSRAGFLTWSTFDDHYNHNLELGIARFKNAKRLANHDGSVWGRQAHDALTLAKHPDGTPAIDSIARMLMEDGYDLKYPPIIEKPIDRARDELALYLRDCEQNASRIHYRQQRPMTSLGDDPGSGFYGDCSELVVAACFWARLKSDVHIPDPSGYGYAGYGNSDSLYQQNRWRSLPWGGSFETGDIAIYGPAFRTRHVTICRAAGSAATAIFTSHGSEAGPFATRVRYRSDLLAIVRPRLVPA